jgi:hypothetical protein
MQKKPNAPGQPGPGQPGQTIQRNLSKERGPARFTESEIDRVVRSVENAGLKIRNVIIREIKIECGDGENDDDNGDILDQLK